MRLLQYSFEVLMTLNYWAMLVSFRITVLSLLSAPGGEACSSVLVLEQECELPQILKALTCYWCSSTGN